LLLSVVSLSRCEFQAACTYSFLCVLLVLRQLGGYLLISVCATGA
jgi:hypothetical protein